MTNLILFVIAAIGLTSIINTSSIMDPLRHWIHNNLPEKVAGGIECSQCVGFWAGTIASIFLDYDVYFQAIQAVAMLAILAWVYSLNNQHNFILMKWCFGIGATGFAITHFSLTSHLVMYGCAGSAVASIALGLYETLVQLIVSKTDFSFPPKEGGQ